VAVLRANGWLDDGAAVVVVVLQPFCSLSQHHLFFSGDQPFGRIAPTSQSNGFEEVVFGQPTFSLLQHHTFCWIVQAVSQSSFLVLQSYSFFGGGGFGGQAFCSFLQHQSCLSRDQPLIQLSKPSSQS